MQRYLIIIEQGPANCSAYVPDLPGCIATGATRADAEANLREAIELHLDALRRDGRPIPPATTTSAEVFVPGGDDAEFRDELFRGLERLSRSRL